ncbi:hybrid sensor histidine kinase/response regulator [Pseudoxanthomonas sangjuensis]|uniref:hybrid sensor histidine kinase/response regulator n=1 Tax=Pseudoxanthomonas sangjuensis TaxID=1503750 RepID=UPI001390BAEB|nr:PAS domain-containing hybrid sensor histidine kinase/response regulator [Pseudoxanthomonas sangjuensis]KAF1713760.1 hybrid sensor histidine kinase/response regulator [Pseudoxanthomonas sangjuensis]
MSSWVLLLVSIGYAALLFAVAWWGDRRPLYPDRPWLRPVVYSLALAVYCSSWTFYGAVGSAVRNGIGYLPIYLGPLLLLLFGWRIIERLALIARSQNTVSIADFISSRYGRSRRLAALVTLIALIGVVPYLALQYKAVALSLGALTGQGAGDTGFFTDPALYVALLMALFAALFGTRQVDATEHHHGMMLAIALESMVKLLAMVAIGVFAYFWLGGPVRVGDAARTLFQNAPPVGFLTQTLLGFLAIVCLPRQFHVAVVECSEVGDIRPARWLFGGYLLLISAMVVPIAAAGMRLFGGESAGAADTIVLTLPLNAGSDALALVAYVGGFSAATGMTIVASIALSTMVSNDLVMPLLLRRNLAARQAAADVATLVLWIRRAAIALLALCAYAYYRSSSGNESSLASYGLIAFAAVAQFAPGLLGGLYWRGASRRGVEIGMLVGFAVWVYTLLLPTLSASGWLGPQWLQTGPFGLHWLRPQQLFNLSGWDPLTHGTFWSLLVNAGTMMLVSARWRPSVDERLRIAPFLDPYAQRQALVPSEWPGSVRVSDLLSLAERVVGERHARRAFAEQAAALNRELKPDAPADRVWVQFTERLLAAAIGAASARLVLTSVLHGSGMELGEVVAVLDEAGQELRFNREILSTTLENISAGVSVVDPNMRLVAWNRRYQQMFGYPEGMLYVGRPVADLIRYNAERGELGEGDVEEHVRKRIAHMRAGTPHVFERVRSDGRVVELRGQSLPGGGYVTSYNDVTDFKRAEIALREANETLEMRVAERSREAEAAQQSKTRFLAAISHDVLQPLNAARLFTSALRESDEPGEQRHLAERIDASLRAAEELLDGLLDVSRLDTGSLHIQLGDFDAGELLRELAAQYAPVAAGRGLDLRVHARRVPVRSDRRLLRRVLQNFIANALRYTRRGRIVLGLRAHGDDVELQVWDTGPGIPEQHMRQIFVEFHRFQQPFDWGEQGLGLGLSICQRISRLLGHELNARSAVGSGSMFSIAVPRAAAIQPLPAPARRLEALANDSLEGLRVLCVDNDKETLDGMRALLGRWKVEILTATTVDEALQRMQEAPAVMLVDYHLHDRLDGLDALDALRAASPGPVVGALLTADGRDELKREARARGGYRLLTKPVKPASLRAFLAAAQSQAVGA